MASDNHARKSRMLISGLGAPINPKENLPGILLFQNKLKHEKHDIHKALIHASSAG